VALKNFERERHPKCLKKDIDKYGQGMKNNKVNILKKIKLELDA
jgi:hypothetical protein